jgi:transposase
MELVSEKTIEETKSYFPRSRGRERVDDRRVISGIVYVLRNGLKWKDVPKEYGPYKTLYNRCIRWSKLGVFARILQKLAKTETKVLMIDTMHLKVHRTAASLRKGRLGSKLHAVCDGDVRPGRLLLTAENVSDLVGTRELMKDLPNADYLLADKGYDADWFREELRQRRVKPCIPPLCHRRIQLPYNVDSYKRRHKIENIFGRLKDWRPIATRYDRCAPTFFSSICIACSFFFFEIRVNYTIFRADTRSSRR